VSHHQGVIDWPAVADDGIAFAYLKATEGGDWTDPRFAQNLAGATGAGLDVGAYHFFTNCAPGEAQANHFLATVPVAATRLPAALDLEHIGQCPGEPDRADLLAEIVAFIETVENGTGRPVVLYVLAGVEEPYRVLDELGDRPRWDRSLFRRPADDDWAIWQYSGYADVDGIDGRVDLNVGGLADLTVGRHHGADAGSNPEPGEA
jgi:lysozyme